MRDQPTMHEALHRKERSPQTSHQSLGCINDRSCPIRVASTYLLFVGW